jgi:hypothetical protein
MQQGLVSFILADPAFVAAMPGGVFPVTLPEGVSVGTTYQIVGGTSNPTFGNLGPQKLRIQINFHAPTYAQADAGRNALRTLLDGFVGLFPDGTFITNILHIQPIDYYDNEPRQFRLSSEYYVYFNL